MNSSWKRWLHILGGSLGLLGVVFVVFRLFSHSKTIDFSRFGMYEWMIICFLSFAYGSSNLLLTRAWQLLMLYFGVDVKNRLAVKIYGLSQLAKYIPGNIFHLAGRQALGMAAGLPTKELAKSAIWELGSIAVAGAFFWILVVPLVWPTTSVLIAVSFFVAMLICASLFARKIFSGIVSFALILQIIFLFVSGLIFVALLSFVFDVNISISLLPALCAAFVVAWLAGFLVPGAPAGVGVRELVLLFLLKSVVIESDLLVAIVFGRIITVCGDFFYFLFSLFIKKKIIPQQATGH